MKKLIDLYKKRISLFDTFSTDIKSWENHVYAIACVKENTTALNPGGYWSEVIENCCNKIIELCDENLSSDICSISRYYNLTVKYHYNRCIKQQTLEPVYMYDFDDSIEFEQIKLSIEMAMTDNNLLNTINLIIDHIEITNRIKKRKFIMENEKIKMSVQQSNQIHDTQVKEMKEQIGYLKIKKSELQRQLKKSKNELEKVDFKIEIFNIESQIEAKQNYVKQYDTNRRGKC
jgi:hypothetical protein